MKTVFVVLVAEIYTLVVRTGVTNPQLFNKVPGPSGPDLETWGCGHVYIYIIYNGTTLGSYTFGMYAHHRMTTY